MSRMYYFAGEAELEERPNPYLKLLSVNQALEMQVAVDLDLLDEDLDRDEPGMILVCEDEEKMEYPNIYTFEKDEYYEDIGTDRFYCAELEWNYSAEHLEIILDYIRSQVEKAGELEIWRVWLGSDDIAQTAKRSACSINELTAEKLQKFYEDDCDNQCIIVKPNV